MDPSEIKKRNASLSKYLNSLSDAGIKELNDKEYEEAENDFKKLKEALAKGSCSFCGNPISHFSIKKPCFHWLLKPNGFKKKHFPLLYNKYSFRRLESYLRWVANTDVPIKNINDLVAEKTSSKKIELTIKYKDLEWSFSCAEADYFGHKDRKEGKIPHYHFQMKKGDLVIINYGAFHIPFHDYDFFSFAAENGEISKMRFEHIHGAGMQEFIDNFSAEEIAEKMEKADNEEDAQFHTSTLVMAKPGTTISGEDLANLIEEQKRTKESMATLVRKLSNVDATSIISPGPGVPDLAKRTKRNRGSKKMDTTIDS